MRFFSNCKRTPSNATYSTSSRFLEEFLANVLSFFSLLPISCSSCMRVAYNESLQCESSDLCNKYFHLFQNFLWSLRLCSKFESVESSGPSFLQKFLSLNEAPHFLYAFVRTRACTEIYRRSRLVYISSVSFNPCMEPLNFLLPKGN